MKVFCNSCQVHFVDEFSKTTEAPCNFWGDMGMSNIDISFKRKVWDWLFSAPADELAIRYRIALQISIGGAVLKPDQELVNKIPGYEQMSLEEKKAAQREHFGSIKEMDAILKTTKGRTKH